GILYLIIAIAAGFHYGYLQTSVFVAGNPVETLQNVQNMPGIFRLGILAGLTGFFCDIAVSVYFYYFLRGVNRGLSLTAMSFRLIQSTILSVNLFSLLIIMLITSPESSIFALDDNQLPSLVYLMLSLHDLGFDIAILFFAVHCFIAAYLFYKSEHFPETIGILFLLAGISYLIDSSATFIWPAATGITEIFVAITATAAELFVVFWLIFAGIRNPPKQTFAR
ncbi:MAG: DUF4386 domain-containing protein, partial [Leptospiraceae bacterium]|nr:DUF4386 domain-containing protein [Leptospiraceae bacterium]